MLRNKNHDHTCHTADSLRRSPSGATPSTACEVLLTVPLTSRGSPLAPTLAVWPWSFCEANLKNQAWWCLPASEWLWVCWQASFNLKLRSATKYLRHATISGAKAVQGPLTWRKPENWNILKLIKCKLCWIAKLWLEWAPSRQWPEMCRSEPHSTELIKASRNVQNVQQQHNSQSEKVMNKRFLLMKSLSLSWRSYVTCIN